MCRKRRKSRNSGFHRTARPFNFRCSENEQIERCDMATAEPLVASSESVFDIGDRLTGLLKEARQECIGGAIPGNVLARLADVVETLRSRVIHKVERDPRSLFDLDERLIELLECADEAAQVGEI